VAHYSKRHGAHGPVTAENFDEVASGLLKDLRTEPGYVDDEHCQVSVTNRHWSVTAFVSGLIVFDNMDLLEGIPSRLPESLCLRDLPDDALRELWRAVVAEDEAALLSFPWSDEQNLAPYTCDFYRK
jgi:hypothetical protein